MGAALRLAHEGDVSDDARPMRGNLREVMEIVENDTAGTFRLMYTVVIDDNVYVLDFFQKKSKSGIKTPQADIDRITARLADAKKRAAALRVKGPK